MRLIDVRVLKEWVENWFTKNRLYHPYAKNNNIPITELYDILEQMPSAQPERKPGKWLIRKFGANAQCSECKMSFSDVYDLESSDAYCRHCGTKMEGLKVITDE